MDLRFKLNNYQLDFGMIMKYLEKRIKKDFFCYCQEETTGFYMEAKGISFSDQISSIIKITGSSTLLMVVFALLCLLLGVLIVKMFSKAWQTQALKRRFFRDLIKQYEADLRTAAEDSDSPDNGD